MRSRFARFLALGVLAAGLLVVHAGDVPGALEWTAVEVSGAVHSRAAYARDDQWTRIRPGDGLSPLAALRTGGRGEAKIVGGAQTLVVGPDSELEMPSLAPTGRAAEALQDRGTVDYEIAGGDTGGLDVVTPYLVAAADAATFRVAILEGRSIVDVFDGTVLVTSRLDGTAATLNPGQGATVDPDSTAGLDLRPVGGEAVAHNR